MKKELKVLLIEDNEGDVELITEAFKSNNLNSEITVMDNGEEAIFYLSSINKHLENRPNLILLDINLPKVDGKEVLHYIKTNDKLKMIPVVMLTTSSLQNDIFYAYSNQANCYIVKPANFKEFINTIRALETFWLDCVTYPIEY
jgi:chemotaxis family two-component system response regulator Rcp1